MSHSFVIQEETDVTIDIKTIYSNSDVYFFPYARYAFLECLKVLQVNSVYLPAFICRDMLAPINSLNLKYYFYEVDENLNPILEDVKSDAILLVNYFGFSNDMRPFVEYKKKYNAIIIEDNAHGFLSKDKNGLLLGTRGDIGLLSIRKTVFLPNGGALLVNSDSLKKHEFKSSMVKSSFEDQHYLKKLNLKRKLFSKYLGIFVLLTRRLLRYIKTGDTIPLPDPLSQKEMPLNSYLTPILKNASLNIDIESEINRRREIYTNIEQYAKKFNIKPIYNLTEYSCPFEFAFIDDGNYKEFEVHLLKKGFFILPWPDLPNEIVEDAPKFYKNVKVVPFLW